MSILIKGMEMPKCCNDCWFYDDSRCYLFSYGVPNRYNYDALTMPDWCELIELPPHGRLIDADVLRKKMAERRSYVGRLSDPLCLIEDAPTIIESEDKE